MKTKKLIFFLLLITILLLFLKFRREYDQWVYKIHMLNGETLEVHHELSWRATYGPRHFEFGGGDDKYSIWFQYKNQKYSWKSPNIPIVIQKWEDTFYLAMFEISEQYYMKFYKLIPELTEISYMKFPKQIAIQNCWKLNPRSFGYEKEPFEAYPIDPESDIFRGSFTAHIWYILETGARLENIYKNDVDKTFLTKFKEKYISQEMALTNKITSIESGDK